MTIQAIDCIIINLIIVVINFICFSLFSLQSIKYLNIPCSICNVTIGNNRLVNVFNKSTTPYSSLLNTAVYTGNKKNVINVKDITFDSDKMEVKKNGDIINLTSLELKILYLFMTNIGKVITRESLINYIYNLTGNDVNDNTITVYLKRIREKIGDNIIETKKGIGYIINEK